jgi:hypothetical protein
MVSASTIVSSLLFRFSSLFFFLGCCLAGAGGGGYLFVITKQPNIHRQLEEILQNLSTVKLLKTIAVNKALVKMQLLHVSSIIKNINKHDSPTSFIFYSLDNY